MDNYNYDTEEAVNTIKGETGTTTCASCGGQMTFDPKSQQIQCAFCGNMQEIHKTKDNIIELDLSKMANIDFNWNAEKKTIICENCGGQTLIEPNDETNFCTFCGSQHIVQRENDDMGMKPQGLIPYTLGMDDAKNQLKQWIRRRYLAPNDLKDRYLNRNFKGVYIPYWTFDADTYTNYHCQVGEYYYVLENDKKVRKTKWRHHSGHYKRFFDDQLVCAISHSYQHYIKKIEPFDLSKVVDYSPDFLAGYYAQKYVIMPNDALNEAKTEMERDIRSDIHGRLPGDTSKNYSQNVRFSDITFKHLLLPIYMMTYVYNNKTYTIMVNGQTGEVQGQSPYSPIKVTLLVLAIITVAILIYYFANS